MSKWDKYKVNENSIAVKSKWDKYKVMPQNGPTNLEVGSKAVASGLLSNLDIPQTIGSIALNPEYAPYGQARKLYNYLKGDTHQPLNGPLDAMPTNFASNTVKSGLKNYANIDLEPIPSNGTQRIIKHAGEFAGGLGPIGLLNKTKGLYKGAKEIGKSGILGGTIGGISGGLQESGVDPLIADIGTSLAIPLVPAASKNLLNKFSPIHRTNKIKKKVSEALRTQIGEENVPEVLENIQKHKRQKKSINLQPTTPELAQNIGLSRLYRTQTNNEAIPLRYKENDVKLRKALSDIGTTGLEESIKGEAIRIPFFEKFNRKKARRTKLTEPLYEELENIQTGLPTSAAKSLLEKEISVSSPGHKAPLEKYLKNLSRNDVTPLNIKRMNELERDLNQIDIQYKDLNPQALNQIKGPLIQELEEIKSSIYPRPIQIENTIQELGDKVNAYARSGESNAARKYRTIKKSYEEDLSKNPVGLKHREEYKRLSKPINEIETSSLLNNFIKENKDVAKREGFVVPSEKISNLIIGADLPNTKILVNKVKGNKELLPLIKGTYIDELLNKSTLSNGNFSYDKANKFLNNKYAKEKINTIFNNKEKKKLDYFLNTLEKRNKVETLGKVSGSDTHQKLKVEQEFNNSLDGIGKLAKHAVLNASGTGQIGKLVTNTFLDIGKRLRKSKYDNILNEALLDPNTFKKLIKDDHSPKTFKDFYNPLPSVAGTSLAFRNRQERSK